MYVTKWEMFKGKCECLLMSEELEDLSGIRLLGKLVMLPLSYEDCFLFMF